MNRNNTHPAGVELPSRHEATTAAESHPKDSAFSEHHGESLWQYIDTITTEPPLLFSGEVLPILTGNRRTSAGGGGEARIPADSENAQVAGTSGGYGPEIKLVIDSIVNLGR